MPVDMRAFDIVCYLWLTFQCDQSIVPYHQGKQLPEGTLKSIMDGSGIPTEGFRN